jgi:hypothetical protein
LFPQDRVQSLEFRNGVRQHRVVLDFLTDLENQMRRQQVKQVGLAEKIGKTRAWVSKVFRRKPNLTFFTAVELADALGMDVQVRAVPRYVRLVCITQQSESSTTVPSAVELKPYRDFKVVTAGTA